LIICNGNKLIKSIPHCHSLPGNRRC